MEEVRRLSGKSEIIAALELCRRVFDEFVGPGYTAEGRDTFRRVTMAEENLSKWEAGEYVFYGAFEGDILIGAAASRMGGNHVMLLFVDKKHHRRGIARSLMDALIADASGDRVTVNASPYAKGAYERMGFAATGASVVESGMIFTPMEYVK